MTEIIGKLSLVNSTMDAIEAHASHLRHLSHPYISKGILISRFKRSSKIAEQDSKYISSHIAQALEYYNLAKIASPSIRPVLQYYCYLNLVVATIISYRPTGFEGYKMHGVEDLTYKLKKVDLSSVMLKVKNNGAIPLFNSIISSTVNKNQKYRLNELIGSIPLLSYEIKEAYKKEVMRLSISEKLLFDEKNVQWSSSVSIKSLNHTKNINSLMPKSKIERAIPILKDKYYLHTKSANIYNYVSKNIYSNENIAISNHKENLLKIINYGGHNISDGILESFNVEYNWYALSKKDFIPTLTASLMLLFSFASIVRYRPNILEQIRNSKLNLIFDVFMNEVDGFMLPSLRNLLFREDMYISKERFI